MAQSASILDAASAGVRALRPYEPGKPVEELERELGLTDIIKLASNENPLGPGLRAREAMAIDAEQLSRYPDGSGHRLRKRIAEIERLQPAQVTLGNGSNDILELVARVFLGAGRRSLFSRHAFAVYPLATLGMNATPCAAPAYSADHRMPYGHDPEALAAELEADSVVDSGQQSLAPPSVLFIANPNNPTGTWLEPDELSRLLAKVPDSTVVVLDEAYREYMRPELRPEVGDLLASMPNLIVTRTFSKVHGLAALRVGYALSSPQIADLLNRVRQPFNNNSLALAAAEAAIDDVDHVARSVRENSAGLSWLRKQFDSIGIEYLPSQANFLTFRVGPQAAAIYQALLERGVIVRPLAGYEMPEHLRVTVGTATENRRFIDALRDVLDNGAVQ